MEALLVLISGICFYFLGRWSHNPKQNDFKVVEAARNRLHKPPVKTGVVKTPTPEEIRKKGTVQGEVDKEMSELLKRIVK